MRSFTLVSTLAASLTALASITACSPYDPDLGGVPYRCAAAEPRCPEDYTCEDNGAGVQVCVSPNGPGPDAGSGSGFQCQDDSMLEGPTGNDTTASAFMTNLNGSNRLTITFAGIAICPEGDRDTYLISVATAMSDIEAITTWAAPGPGASGQPVSVTILNMGGATIAPSTSAGEMSQRAFAANVPAGTYYIQTYAAATAKNNYSLKMTITP